MLETVYYVNVIQTDLMANMKNVYSALTFVTQLQLVSISKYIIYFVFTFTQRLII